MMDFYKGDRVMLSPEGMQVSPRKAKYNPNHIGTVARITGEGHPVVHWDGNKVPACHAMHPSFLKHAD